MNILFPDLLAFISLTRHFPEGLYQAIEHAIHLHPTIFLIALAILPALGLPISPICLLGGAVYGVRVALLFGFSGIAINLLLTYFLSTCVLRNWLKRFLAKRGHYIWTVPQGDAWRAVLMVRLMPVIPMAAQSYLLGLAGIALKPYFWVSLIIEALYMTAFVVSAGTFLNGNWGYLVFGVSLFIIIILSTQIMRHGRNSTNRTIS